MDSTQTILDNLIKKSNQIIYSVGDSKIIVQFSEKLELVINSISQVAIERNDTQFVESIKELMVFVQDCLQRQDYVLLRDVVHSSMNRLKEMLI